MGKSKEQFLQLRESRKAYREIQEIIAFNKANKQQGITLRCVHCRSCEVTYHQSVGDAYCSDCGEWQAGEEFEQTELHIAEQIQENLLTLCSAYGLNDIEFQDKMCDIVVQGLKKN